MNTPEDDEDREWEELATAEFLKGYAESDAIYDDYFSRPHEDPQMPTNTEQLRPDHERRQ
jgi:hypothetical protein